MPTTDWNNTRKRFPNNRMGNLFRFQGHSFGHFVGECTASSGDLFPNPPKRRSMACPLCGFVQAFGDFTEEHCPQRAGQSDFGGAACIVLTCGSCNKKTNELFEKFAAHVRQGRLQEKQTMGHISISATDGLWIVESLGDAQVTYTNLKTAFLIGFAVLGYRFALAHALDEVRTAILTGDMDQTLDSADDLGEPSPIGGPIPQRHLPDRSPFTVLESTQGIVEVVGEDFGWQFPVNPDARLGTQDSRSYRWPTSHGSGSEAQFMQYWQDNCLFHLEWCSEPADHPWAFDSPPWTAIDPATMK